MADATPTVPPSRLKKFFAKSPAAMLKSLRWNLNNIARATYNKARFGAKSHAPGSAYTAYYPDSLPSFPEARNLYSRWLRGNRTNNNGDAPRFLALLLNLRQLNAENILGDFAELGVWKGNSAAIFADFAAKSNRRLFLFDTFSGFDNRDLINTDESHAQSHAPLFADTSIDEVRATVGHPEITTYLPGFFPGTITDEVRATTFALAHIDCDLYEPMKAALEFFYPRLSPGGMLILHDYSSGTWAGATQAIDEFLKSTNEFVTLWPDKSGTAILRKSR